MYSKRIKRTVASILFKFISLTRCHLLLKPFYAGLGSILMFHRVCPDSSTPRIRGNSGLEVTPEYLENTIRYLRENNYEIVSLARATQILNNNHREKRFVVFTFDDGYMDNYLYAYPIFKRHEVPFTIYVTTHFPDGEAILWWYLLEDLILEQKRIEFEFNDREYKYSCISLREKEWAFQEIHKLIMNGPSETLNQRVQQIFKNYDVNLSGKTTDLALNWQQIREMSQDPLVEIGAHTINHYPLNKLSESKAKEEMEGSRKRIEIVTGQKVEHFSYPFGTLNEIGGREFQLAKQCGFKTSTTTCTGNIFPEHKNLLEQLPRIPINQKRDNGNINILKLWLYGTLPCLINKFKRVV